MQAEEREGLGTRRAKLLGQDRRVGERVAVDLAGRFVGDHAVAGLPERERDLRGPLVDVERPGEGLFRRDPGVAEAREPPHEHVDLQLGALRRITLGG